MQKGFAPILIVILIAIIVGGYLIYKYVGFCGSNCIDESKVFPADSASLIKQTPQPIATPQVASVLDETANWKTYRDQQIRFELQYPSEMILPRSNCDTFVLPASDNERKQVENLKKSGQEIALTITGLEFAVCEMSNPKELSLKEFAEQHSPQFNFTEFNVSDQVGLKLESKAAGKNVGEIFVISPDNSIIRIWYRYTLNKDEEIVNQILSTFKFTQ